MEFDTAFSAAVAAMDEQYVHVPVADSAPVIRERAFAYELYYRLRESCGIAGYTLTGELEKAAHPDLRGTDTRRLAPDLLVHVPGDRRGNHVAIEIKGGMPRIARFHKDLASLCLLRDHFGYQRLIYFVYGVKQKQVKTLVVRIQNVRMLRGRPADLTQIELWVRVAGEREARPVQWAHNKSSQLTERPRRCCASAAPSEPLRS
jgi:hypothetical protein